MTISPDKAKAVDSAMGQIERQFGKGAIMKLGARPIENIPVISTGSIELDRALGIGGLPRGRVIEIFGPESSGKTTLALHAVAQAQKQGGIAAFIDAEHALDTGTPANWASTVTNCWSPSPIPASRPWKSPTCWCAAGPST
jgi:recombination protein RecA